MGGVGLDTGRCSRGAAAEQTFECITILLLPTLHIHAACQQRIQPPSSVPVLLPRLGWVS